MTDYKNVQFIALNIKPDYRDEPTQKCFCGCPSFDPFFAPDDKHCISCWKSSNHKCSDLHKLYLGDLNHDKDMTYRFRIMKETIETAYYEMKMLSNAKSDAKASKNVIAYEGEIDGKFEAKTETTKPWKIPLEIECREL